MNVIVKTLAVLGLAAGAASAQGSLDATIQKLSGQASKEYISPMVSGFGASMNAGWYHKAPPPKKFGFHVEGGVVMMGALLKGGAKTFEVQDQFTFDQRESEVLLAFIDDPNGPYNTLSSSQRDQLKDSLAQRLATIPNNVTITGPTITGSKSDHLEIQFSGSTFATGLSGSADPNNQFPDTVSIPAKTIALANAEGDTLAGFKLPGVALPTPQLTLGTVYGSNLTLRWLPTYTVPDVGAIKFFGFGIQHNPGVWMNSKMPVDLSVGYFTQKLEIGDIFEASSTAYGLNVSKTLGWRFLNVTPYGGVQYESSNMKVNYQRTVTTDTDTEGQQIDVKFSLDGENKYRATTGLSIRLLAININADYNFAKYPSASFGLMVGI